MTTQDLSGYSVVLAASAKGSPDSFGPAKPSFMSMYHGKIALLRSIESLAVSGFRTILVILEEQDQLFGISGLVLSDFPDVSVVRLPRETKGALISALSAMGGLNPSLPLVVGSGDSYVEGGVASFVESWVRSGVSGGVLAFESDSERFSYVLAERDQVVYVAEKQRISSLATTGTFYFKSVSVFLEAAEWTLVNNNHLDGRFYNSSTLNYLVTQGMRTEVVNLAPALYHPMMQASDFLERE